MGKMTPLTATALIFFGLLVCACHSRKQARTGKTTDAQAPADRAALDIQTVELPVPADPTISLRTLFRTGSQMDPPGKQGLASLTAAMLTRAATKHHSYAQILELLYPMAAGYEASVDKEMTVISGRVHRDNLTSYLELYTQAILEPAFGEDDFARIKTDTLNYLEKTLRYSNDEAFGKEVFFRSIFCGTPYGHPTEGLIESVRSITLDDVRQFYRNTYTRENAIIGIGGGYKAEQLTVLQRRLAALPAKGVTKPDKPKPEAIEGLEVTLVEKDTRSTAISFGFPIDVLRGDDDYHALWLARSWLGEHRNASSHLYQVIRDVRGLNYGDYAYIEYFPDGWALQFPPPNVGRRQQVFEVWIRPVENQAAHFVLRAAVRELEELVKEGMTREDFELTKRFLKKYIRHYAPSTDARLGYRLDDVFYGTTNHLEALPEKLDALTLEQVNAAIEKHLQHENLRITMITKNAQALREALIADVPSPMKYKTPKPPKVLAEDGQIATYPLRVKPDGVRVVQADDLFVR